MERTEGNGSHRTQSAMTIAEKIYIVLTVAFGLFWLGFLVFKPVLLSTLWPGNPISRPLYVLLALWLTVLLLYGVLLYQLQKRCPAVVVAMALFVLCALPRLVVLQFHHYLPTNDFANYLLYGQCFLQGDYGPAADLIANYYQMPKMGGLLVFNGLLMTLFGQSLLGLQLANVVMTSLIGVMLYLLLRPVHRQAAWLTALLWAVYPSNLISTQIPTNHHGAVLFFLLALLFYQPLLSHGSATRPWWQIGLLAAATGLCLTISNLIHPSVIIIQLSILCFTVLAVLHYASREGHLLCRPNRQLLAALVILLVTGSVTQQLCMEQLRQQQIITDDREISVLFKLVLGFNPERNGSFVEYDYTYIRELPENEQNAACLALLKQRLTQPAEVLQFLLQKTDMAWFERDGYFYWYNEGALLEYSAQMAQLTEAEHQQYAQTIGWIDAAQALDIVMLRLVYWLALLGLWSQRRFTGAMTNVLFFIPLGWTAVILLTEMQSRYRYPAMPVFFALAALGLCALWQWSENKQGRHRTLKRKAGESLE